MQDGKASPISSRPWRVIAEELSQETDSQRILELSFELNRALDEQGISIDPCDPGDARRPPTSARPH